MHEVVFTRSHWSMTAPNKTQSLYSVLFELPGKETSCNSYTLQIPFHQYRSLLIMTKIPKRTGKIWKASFCALYIYIYIQLCYVSVVFQTACYKKTGFSFHLTSCCRPKYGLLLPFPLPPGGADVIRRGLNIVCTDVCVCKVGLDFESSAFDQGDEINMGIESWKRKNEGAEKRR